MRTDYETYASSPTFVFPSRFEARWDRVKPLLRLHFVARDDEDYVNALLEDACQHLFFQYTHETELMETSSDAEWVQIALRALLRINEKQSPFEKQFEVIERRLQHWARQHFKAELVDDVVQGAFIKLWNDYQRHQQEWDVKAESYWVNCGKLAMRSTCRDLLTQTCHRTGSSRRREKNEWVQWEFRASEFPLPDDGDEDEQNDLLDLLSQSCDIDIHGEEVRRANLRLDLERLLNTVRVHYRPAIFERCLLVLERLAEGYTAGEIRLELGWTQVTYDGTMTFVRQMSQFAEGYKRAPNRCTKMTSAEIGRIHTMRRAGYSQPKIARIVGRNPKTVWSVLQTTEAS
ncbi:MAG: helix-turn-helix domain-containing protein [Aggregatilineales bacterium]